MDYGKLQKLRAKVYFKVHDVQEAFGVKQASARVLCHRYVQQGLFVRLKNNFYVLGEKWDNFSRDDFLRLANFLQVPSYISFASALSFYELTTQIQRNFFESASLRRSLKYTAQGISFTFYKLQKPYYFDFMKYNDIFIATKEKAFVDSVYLYSLGKYRLDFHAIDLEKLDKRRMKKLLTPFPSRTQDMIQKICKI